MSFLSKCKIFQYRHKSEKNLQYEFDKNLKIMGKDDKQKSQSVKITSHVYKHKNKEQRSFE